MPQKPLFRLVSHLAQKVHREVPLDHEFCTSLATKVLAHVCRALYLTPDSVALVLRGTHRFALVRNPDPTPPPPPEIPNE